MGIGIISSLLDPRKLIQLISAKSIALVVVIFVFILIKPEKINYSSQQLRMADHLAEEVGSWVYGLGLSHESAFFANLNRDPSGIVSNKIYTSIQRTDAVNLLKRGIIHRFLKAIDWSLPTHDLIDDFDSKHFPKQTKYVIGGEILQFRDIQESKVLELRIDIYECSSGKLLQQQVFQSQPVLQQLLPSVSANQANGSGSFLIKMVIWIAVFLVFPFVCLLFKETLSGGHNAGALLLLAGCVFVDLLMAYAVGFFRTQGWIVIFLMLTILTLSLFKNYKLLEFLQEKMI